MAHVGAAFVRSPVGFGLRMRNEAFDTMGSLRTGLVPPLMLQSVPRDSFSVARTTSLVWWYHHTL